MRLLRLKLGYYGLYWSEVCVVFFRNMQWKDLFFELELLGAGTLYNWHWQGCLPCRSGITNRSCANEEACAPVVHSPVHQPWPLSSPEAALLLVSTKNRDLCPDPIFWACAEYSFGILSQSDLSHLTGSPWIADLRCWTNPEVAILGADQKGHGFWGWKCSPGPLLIFFPYFWPVVWSV